MHACEVFGTDDGLSNTAYNWASHAAVYNALYRLLSHTV